MDTIKKLMWLVAIALLAVSSCKDNEDEEIIGDYKYYLTIQSQVRLNLKEEDESQGTMSNSDYDLLSRTILQMQHAVVDNESIQGDIKAKEAALFTICDSLYRNYADMNPEHKGRVVCFVKLIRSRLNSDGTIKDAESLKYYQFWREGSGSGNGGNDSTSNYLAKPAALEAVDLGLSVLWANINLGGQSPDDYGGHYAWGDPTGKLWSGAGITWNMNTNTYSWNTENYGGNNPPADISGTALDIVSANWGDGWRLPTYDEAKELCEQCQWKLRNWGDIKWYEVIGPNGNSIIFKLAGYYGDDLSNRFHAGPYFTNEIGYYWTSTICPNPTADYIDDGVKTAWFFYCRSRDGDLTGKNMFTDELRALHFSIRAVHDK